MKVLFVNMKTHARRCAAALLAVAVLASAPVQADDTDKSRTQKAMEAQWGELLKGSGEWRTPNPDFADPAQTAKDYAIRWKWGPYKQHVTGELLGVFETPEGPKEALYWTFVSYHNPITEEITLVQIGWDGTMGAGAFSTDADSVEQLDQIFYGADGVEKAVRHKTIVTGPDSHDSDVYERDEAGEWELKRQWTWTRVKK